jgi:hypothetical protein
MKVIAIKYHHRHGTDVILARPDGITKLPDFTNALLKRLGVDAPELEREDEWAEWVGPFEVWKLPSLNEAVKPRRTRGEA